MSQTIRESLAQAIADLERQRFDAAKRELLYALATLNYAARGEDGRRLMHDWDDETIADLLPRTLDAS